MPSARILLKALILTSAICVAVAAALALGGRWSWRLDILTHFAPVYLAAGAAALIVALFLRASYLRLGLALCGAIAVFGSAALILPELTRPMATPAPEAASGQVKLIQFNMRGGKDGLEESIHWLAAEKPDILVVEEGDAALRETLTRRLKMHSACGQTCKVILFSRAPPVGVDKPRRGFYGRGPAITVGRYADARGPFTVVGVHFTWPTDRWHRENNRRLEEILETYPRDRMILAGDFNSTPWSFSRRRSDDRLRMERLTRALRTWPASGPPGFAVLPIDHVYAGRGWAVVEVGRGPALGSDHHPVVARLAPAS